MGQRQVATLASKHGKQSNFSWWLLFTGSSLENEKSFRCIFVSTLSESGVRYLVCRMVVVQSE